MGNDKKKSFRLGSTITLDTEVEKDLIELVERLSNQHKLGQVMMNLLRVYTDTGSVDAIKDLENNLIQMKDNTYISVERLKKLEKIESEVLDLSKKMDSVVKLCNELYLSSLVGNKLFAEGASEETLIQSYLIERYIKKMVGVLGIDFKVQELDFWKNNSVITDIQKEELAEEVCEHITKQKMAVLGALKTLGNVSIDVGSIHAPEAQNLPQKYIEDVNNYRVDTTKEDKRSKATVEIELDESHSGSFGEGGSLSALESLLGI